MKYLRQIIRQILTEGIQIQRLHHSRITDRPGDELNLGPYPQKSTAEQFGPVKPNGIWYDCGGAWENFCEFEMGSYKGRNYDAVYEIIPNEATVLFITNLQEFEDFEKEYKERGKSEPVINWKSVADKYDGIEICPYLSKKRMAYGSFWYYGWDVASGCIWAPGGMQAAKRKC